MNRRSLHAAALLMALGALHGIPALPRTESKPIDRAKRERKLTKAEKKRAKRAARNLRLAATTHQEPTHE